MARKSTTKSVPPQNLTGFIDAFEQYTLRPNYPLNCYRGQRDASWPIVAGIFRFEFKEECAGRAIFCNRPWPSSQQTE